MLNNNPALDLLVEDLKDIIHNSLLHYVDRATKKEGYLATLTMAAQQDISMEVDEYLDEAGLGGMDKRVNDLIMNWGRLYFVEYDRMENPIPLIWSPGVSQYDNVNELFSRVRFSLQNHESDLYPTYDISLKQAIELLPPGKDRATVASVSGWPYVKHRQSMRNLKARLSRLEHLTLHTSVLHDLDKIMDTDLSSNTMAIYNVLLAVSDTTRYMSPEQLAIIHTFNHRKLCKMLTKITGKNYNV